jgi:methylglutaconyl-CoA hydratase
MGAIRTELEERWVWIILNRPEKRNALNYELITELDRKLAAYQEEAEPRVLIISGEGNAFCSGLDLEELQKMSGKSYAESLQDARNYAQLLKRIYLHPKPIIAAVNGPAVAGGCGLASVCDLTIAASSAKLGYTEARIGFVPVIVSYFLVRIMGEKSVREMLMTAKLMEAVEAQRLGLVNEVVEMAELRSRVREAARRLSQNSPHSLKLTKRLLGRLSAPDLDEALEYGCELNAQSRSAPDCVEGVAAFLEKRSPRWA